VLQQNIGIALALARYFVGDHEDVDIIARQDEAGNPTQVIDAHRHRAFALLELRSKRGALASSGNF